MHTPANPTGRRTLRARSARSTATRKRDSRVKQFKPGEHLCSHVRPAPIFGADFQAGVTPGNHRLKVMLDGEPVVGATAAKAGTSLGWVRTYDMSPMDPPRYGRVQIVPGDRY